jgi:hypothetical protein
MRDYDCSVGLTHFEKGQPMNSQVLIPRMAYLPTSGVLLKSAAFALWLCFGIRIHSGLAGEPTNTIRPDLVGTVFAETGFPLSNAMAFVYTAKPRVGPSLLCPSCYADCRKTARTDAKGQFKLESLDPSLLFRILVAAPGRQPVFLEAVDPTRQPIEVDMLAVTEAQMLPHKFLRGRVVDPRGQPVPAATLKFLFFSGEEANCGGDCAGVDMLAVTDLEGRFLFTADKKFDVMSLTVEAPGFAPRRFLRLSNARDQELKITEGATVAGRVIRQGQPLAGVTVGMSSADRAVDNFLGDFTAETDAQGRFQFYNMAPYHIFQIYGVSGSLGGLGTIPPRRVRVAADGSTKDVGDLAVVSGAKLSGRLVLTDGRLVPPGARLVLDSEETSGTITAFPHASGAFEFANVPPSTVCLVVTLPGYHVSEKNRSFDWLNEDHLLGRLDHDLEGLEILLEPGHSSPPKREDLDRAVRETRPKTLPLSGVESAR